MNTIDRQRLIDAACAARLLAYAPYSHFLVGAALLTSDDRIFTGCNVENVSYGLTICAERVAAGTAVAAGQRTFSAIAIATAAGSTPCGACRQVLAEFCDDLPVCLVAVETGCQITETTLAKLLPGRFDL